MDIFTVKLKGAHLCKSGDTQGIIPKLEDILSSQMLIGVIVRQNKFEG